jgi:hypothetical protein
MMSRIMSRFAVYPMICPRIPTLCWDCPTTCSVARDTGATRTKCPGKCPNSGPRILPFGGILRTRANWFSYPAKMAGYLVGLEGAGFGARDTLSRDLSRERRRPGKRAGLATWCREECRDHGFFTSHLVDELAPTFRSRPSSTKCLRWRWAFGESKPIYSVKEPDIESCGGRCSRSKLEGKALRLRAALAHIGPSLCQVRGAFAIFADVLFPAPDQPPSQRLGLQLGVGVGVTFKVGTT